MTICLISKGVLHGENYPEGIIRNTRPKNVIPGHWEDFFRKQGKPVKALRVINVGNFIKRLEAVLPEDSKWLLPKPFTQMRFPPNEK